MSLTCRTQNSQGTIVVGTTALGRGGEGSVYPVTSHNVSGLLPAGELVAKIYHDPAEGNREGKVRAMVSNPPHNDSLAWPLGVVYDDKKFIGYVMVKLDTSKYQPWVVLADSGQRKKQAPDFDVRYAITASTNLAVAMKSIHDAGHCVGDVNESNILVASDASVMLVDTDSAQIVNSDGTVFPCFVGKPEYTAAEISHGKLKDNPRTPATDVFAYAVVVYQMLTGGAHPTDASYTGSGNAPTTLEKIRNGWYPGITSIPAELSPVARVPINGIPVIFRKIFARCLSTDPSRRLSMAQILSVENELSDNLVQCKAVKTHWYDKRDGACKWCEHSAKGAPDPWNNNPVKRVVPAKTHQQKKLPAVNFSSAAPQNIRRAAPGASTRAPMSAQPTGAQTPLVGTPRTPQTVTPATAPAPQHGGLSASQKNQPPLSSYKNTAANPAPPVKPQAPQRVTPQKIKGRSVVSYADGRKGPRPSLAAVAQQDPKLAARLFSQETPDLAKFWWEAHRNKPGMFISVLSAVVATFISLMWPTWVNMLIPFVGDVAVLPQVISLLGIVAAFTSFFATVVLLLSSIVVRIRNSRKYAPQKKENPALVAFQYGVVTVLWGPLCVVFLTLTTTMVALRGFLNLVTDNKFKNLR